MIQSRMKWKAEQTENPLLENEALRQSALAAFSALPFGEASLNDILKKAGLNKGSFYYRFYDKMDLYLSLISLIGDEKQRILQEWDYDRENTDTFFLLKMQISLGLRFAQQSPQYDALWKRLLSEDRAVRAVIDEEFGENMNSHLLNLIASAKEKGDIRADIPTPLLVNILRSILSGLDAALCSGQSGRDIEALADEAIEIIKGGISPVSPRSTSSGCPPASPL